MIRPHVADLLALYYLDVLDDVPGSYIEQHLAVCEPCRLLAVKTAETVAALALMSGDSDGDAVSNAKRTADRRLPATRAGTRPAPRPGSLARNRPGGRSRRRRAVLAAQLGLVLTIAVGLGGLAIGALVDGSADDRAMATVAAAAQGVPGTSLSVVVTQTEGGVRVRATVDGLQAGARHRLYAVDLAGVVLLVSEWTAEGQVQEISGDVAVTLPELAYLTVAGAEGATVVTVQLPRQATPTVSGR